MGHLRVAFSIAWLEVFTCWVKLGKWNKEVEVEGSKWLIYSNQFSEKNTSFQEACCSNKRNDDCCNVIFYENSHISSKQSKVGAAVNCFLGT